MADGKTVKSPLSPRPIREIVQLGATSRNESYSVLYAANSHTYYYYYFSITHSLVQSRLKTFLFCKSFPPQPFIVFFRTDYRDSPRLLLLLLSISVFTFQFFCFTLFSCRFRAVD